MAISPEIDFWAGLEAQRLLVGFWGWAFLLISFFNEPRSPKVFPKGRSEGHEGRREEGLVKKLG
ncbi:MAG: hypothetical protein EAZ76_08030 [Nostocales cyanobacterium]|nr:MAG: hypothetical protein EAZ87_15530 [Nostocales cyanobacterium]TAF16032.1 MAG: hypothetical protein EAZ76_08030 [Nostocales cyanobacterium]